MTKWEETFSREIDGNVREIIFSLDMNGEDDIGKILEILDGKGNRLFNHETFNNYSTHGFEDVFEHNGCDRYDTMDECDPLQSVRGNWDDIEVPFPLNLIHDI